MFQSSFIKKIIKIWILIYFAWKLKAFSRSYFINASVHLLPLYDFDGIDIDWRTPGKPDKIFYKEIILRKKLIK